MWFHAASGSVHRYRTGASGTPETTRPSLAGELRDFYRYAVT